MTREATPDNVKADFDGAPHEHYGVTSRMVREGDRFFMVTSGTADVLLDGYRVGSVRAGGYFGEKALLRAVPRTATVKACDPMSLLALSRADFLAALTGRADAGKAVFSSPGQAGATDWTRRHRVNALGGVSLFSHLDGRALRELAGRSVLDHWPAGARILRQGEDGDRFFLVLDGRAVVSVGAEKKAELHPGDQFGEVALLYGVPRLADVTASSPLVTLSLARDDFVSAVGAQPHLG